MLTQTNESTHFIRLPTSTHYYDYVPRNDLSELCRNPPHSSGKAANGHVLYRHPIRHVSESVLVFVVN